MKKISGYILGVLCWLNAGICCATEKFEVLPDLPDPLAAYAQSAEAASVSGNTDVSSLVGTQSVGHELSLVSAFFALLLTIVLIYVFVIILSKFNKANIKLMQKQQRELSKLQASVISTTALGNNKTLHVVELDGKRMLIGASANAIQLIKDLGTVTTEDSDDEKEFSHIEIPTIKIPKIEIPKIEIPTINFAKLATKIHKDGGNGTTIVNEDAKDKDDEETVAVNKEVINEESDEQNSDNIIDSLFAKSDDGLADVQEQDTNTASEHIVDPDEYALYKKYLG